jgi:hypothetical protein
MKGPLRPARCAVVALAVWVIAASPLDPLGGLCTGAVLLAAAETGGIGAAIAAHFVAAALSALAA